jgi:hypothetical protein
MPKRSDWNYPIAKLQALGIVQWAGTLPQVPAQRLHVLTHVTILVHQAMNDSKVVQYAIVVREDDLSRDSARSLT